MEQKRGLKKATYIVQRSLFYFFLVFFFMLLYAVIWDTIHVVRNGPWFPWGTGFVGWSGESLTNFLILSGIQISVLSFFLAGSIWSLMKKNHKEWLFMGTLTIIFIISLTQSALTGG